MTALTASTTAIRLIFRRRFAVHSSRRALNLTPLPPLPIHLRLPGFINGRKERRRGRGGGVWAEEELAGNHHLEAEIFEFMEKSANPMRFPTRDDLIAAGREDLAAAIAKEGGWLAFGWDLAGDSPREEDSLKTDLDSFWASSEDSSRVYMEDAGIEGILSRLEKERSLAFGFGSGSSKEKEAIGDQKDEMSRNLPYVTVGSIQSTGMCGSSNLGEGLHHHPSVQNSHHESLMDTNNNSEPGTWRSWSIQRSGDPLSNFEAAEIVIEEDERKSNFNFVSHHLIEKDNENGSVGRLTSGTSNENNCPYDNQQGSLKSEISVYLQHLESQLTSTLKLLKFRSNSIHSYEGQDQESLLKQLHNLSDALEFQQNEMKNARDILRSTRAKLAVMEGKVALEVSESQKVIEEKQMRLAAVEWSLRTLRSVCIVWPNYASEVLLAGSFDGWTSQWRMEKNDSGVFSLCLKLYPGRYEMKFIVDGIWAVDRLRPIANNNGFENNLLIVT